MQRLVLVLLMGLVLAACGSDGDTEAVKRIAAAGDGSVVTKGRGQCALPAACLDLSDLGITSLPPKIERLLLYVEGNPLDAASLALLQRLEARGVDLKKPN